MVVREKKITVFVAFRTRENLPQAIYSKKPRNMSWVEAREHTKPTTPQWLCGLGKDQALHFLVRQLCPKSIDFT